MFNSIDDKSDKNRFTEYLNEILSAENAIVERLHKRVQETQFPESKNTLQHELQEEKNHQSRLKNLISEYGGKPTDSKAKLLSLNSATAQTIDITDNSSENDKKIKSSLHGDDNDNMNNDDVITPLESEILRIKEDAMIKNAEILGYKMVLKIAEKINAKDAIKTLKKNLQEKELTYNKLINSASETLNQIEDDDNKKNYRTHKQNVSFQLGSAIADILTSSWNSKENPSKV
ncbi:MAG TPA: DUF892 family protein, partial [Nitrososphaeraceae archaeon]|nr:DUF892 family protein [Nitrososphaeraceae archaeon]